MTYSRGVQEHKIFQRYDPFSDVTVHAVDRDESPVKLRTGNMQYLMVHNLKTNPIYSPYYPS